MGLLTELERQELVASHPDWSIGDVAITRTFAFDDFVGAMGFVTRVALLAQRANHHPDIDIRWNEVTLSLSTHSEGGLTRKDVELAERIESL